jgi:hypothetical protein
MGYFMFGSNNTAYDDEEDDYEMENDEDAAPVTPVFPMPRRKSKTLSRRRSLM